MNGARAPEVKPEIREGDTTGETKHIDVTIACAGQSDVKFKVKKTTSFEKVFKAWAKQTGLDGGAYRFVHEGTRIYSSQVPEEIGLQSGDTITAFVEQVGGQCCLDPAAAGSFCRLC